MASSKSQRKVVIIGAGASGPVMAIFLARRGYDVEIYECRPDLRLQGAAAGKSVNITLAKRGLLVLDEIGLPKEELMRHSVPLKGRMVHAGNGRLSFQAYGETDDEVIHSVLRNDINILLLNLLEATQPGVKLFFRHRCVGLDRNSGTVTIRNEETGEEMRIQPDAVIGADGTFSTVRQQMQKGLRANYSQSFLSAGYRELRVPARADGEYKMNPNGLHVWPRGDGLLLAIPNPDGSFTCTCILPFERERSFATLQTPESVMEFFQTNFTDIVPLIPHLAEEFMKVQTAGFITTSTSMWHYEDKVVLLGDAVHTVTPFYGQGMNAAFEDCSVLNECIGKYEDDWKTAFAEFQRLRKRHTDALGELSVTNYYELCDKVKMPRVALRKKIDFGLHKLFPKRWVPLYTMISHSTMPYADAIERARKQERILTYCGVTFLFHLLTISTRLWLRFNGKRQTSIQSDHVSVPQRSVVAKEGNM